MVASGVLFDRLFDIARQVDPVGDLTVWRARHEAVTAGETSSIGRAILGAAAMDRLGYVFASGYRSAMEALLPGGPLAVMAATETGGAHPRAIATKLENGRVTGTKEWCTLGPLADDILVIAKIGEKDGRPLLCAARVHGRAKGVTMTALPALPFVPEIPHARLTLDSAEAEVLPGDGYDHYLKPFRTIEDIHVHAAVVAHVVSLAIRGEAPRALIERGLALLASSIELARLDPSPATTHLTLGGVLEASRELAAQVPGDERWRRDLPILEVAGKRAKRGSRPQVSLSGMVLAGGGGGGSGGRSSGNGIAGADAQGGAPGQGAAR